MNISVNHLDRNGNHHQRDYTLTRLAFAKHLAIAGQGYAPHLNKLFRTVGMFIHYSAYLQREAFYSNRFSEPPHALSDPTEKGQFSNLAGKAIADYLSKQIDRSLYTVNYEAAMRVLNHRIRGERPDLIAYSPNNVIAIEAKGRSQGNPGNMMEHKQQSRTGPINVTCSVACVSFNLFNQVTCNYHDPVNSNTPYDNLTLRALTRNYYSGLMEFLNTKFFEYSDFEFGGERFYEVYLTYRSLEGMFKEEWPLFRPFFFYELLDHYRPSLILPKEIRFYASNGITNEVAPFEFQSGESNNIYIDNDRVGLRIRA